MKKFYGKYRGMVISNEDPERLGRLLLQVPDVQGLAPTTWAMPCVPIAGIQNGIWCVPQPGAAVWVEFEQGNPDFPIWTGGFWASKADVPSLAHTAPPANHNIILQTLLQTGLTLSDNPSIGIILRTSLGAMIVVNEAGIVISNGKGATIAMTSATVTLNAGALTVT
jgi:uncharacterized protein involved in type VI secretion and phage assembly